MEHKEYFTEIFNPPDKTAEIIHKNKKTMLFSINLNVLNLHGYCFDGIANTSS